mmetsp:Transcript_36103/g.72418  ORF Transcript_36103/g.72418 Transcript_36103/m.72418 type:complete len:270 (-) Transcript_36103:5794-6603(-)
MHRHEAVVTGAHHVEDRQAQRPRRPAPPRRLHDRVLLLQLHARHHRHVQARASRAHVVVAGRRAHDANLLAVPTAVLFHHNVHHLAVAVHDAVAFQPLPDAVHDHEVSAFEHSVRLHNLDLVDQAQFIARRVPVRPRPILHHQVRAVLLRVPRLDPRGPPFASSLREVQHRALRAVALGDSAEHDAVVAQAAVLGEGESELREIRREDGRTVLDGEQRRVRRVAAQQPVDSDDRTTVPAQQRRRPEDDVDLVVVHRGDGAGRDGAGHKR